MSEIQKSRGTLSDVRGRSTADFVTLRGSAERCSINPRMWEDDERGAGLGERPVVEEREQVASRVERNFLIALHHASSIELRIIGNIVLWQRTSQVLSTIYHVNVRIPQCATRLEIKYFLAGHTYPDRSCQGVTLLRWAADG